MRSDGDNLSTTGLRRRLTPGDADSLAARVRAFFADLDGGPALLVGALPFERHRDDFLFQPEGWVRAASVPQPRREPLGARWAVRAEPSAAAYARSVEGALEMMSSAEAGALVKVVLSRSLVLDADRPIDPLALLARLADDPSVTCFMTPTRVDGGAGPPRVLVGATPELLVSKRGAVVVSHPLAGSAPRCEDAASDRDAAAALERSDKDHREHATVVEAILDILAPYCASLSADPPTLRATAAMWHLGTRIEGRLKDEGVSSAELAAALHPTPAVGGSPRRAAEAAIRELESYDRGFYAGAVGWTNDKGDGAWHVSLRCAEIMGTSARIYAGAGIVPGSDPMSEVRETSAKFQTMLRALGVDEGGNPSGGAAS